MKKSFGKFSIMLAIMFLFAFANLNAQSEKASAKSGVYTVNNADSYIKWTGSKPLGEHFGSLKIKEGQLEFQNGQLTGGNFVIDMNSMKVEDIDDPEMNAKLLGHLKSADFFNVAEHPEAMFVIKKAKMVKGDGYNYEIHGHLTIKDISKPVQFRAMIQKDGNMLMASTPEFEIDRTDWDIKFKSKSFFENLKDNFIYDDMGIEINLSAKN